MGFITKVIHCIELTLIYHYLQLQHFNLFTKAAKGEKLQKMANLQALADQKPSG